MLPANFYQKLKDIIMDIFDKIEILSYKLADKTVNKSKDLTGEQRKEEKEIWDYFYFMILSQVFTFFFVIFFGIIFNYLFFLIFSMLSFCTLRMKGGGYHCDSFKKCFITTNVSFLIVGLLGKIFYISFSDFYIELFLLSSAGIFFIIPSVPLPWGNEESRGYEEDKKFQLQYRDKSIQIYLIGLIIILLFENFNFVFLKKILIGISFGLILTTFSSSKIGCKLLEKLWNKIADYTH